MDRLVIAALGDSITAGTPLWDPDPAVRAAVAEPDETHSWPYWVQQSDPSLALRNFGVDLELEDFDRISRNTPVLADMRPWGTYTAPEMYEAGGMPVVGKRLLQAGLGAGQRGLTRGQPILIARLRVFQQEHAVLDDDEALLALNRARVARELCHSVGHLPT